MHNQSTNIGHMVAIRPAAYFWADELRSTYSGSEARWHMWHGGTCDTAAHLTQMAVFDSEMMVLREGLGPGRDQRGSITMPFLMAYVTKPALSWISSFFMMLLQCVSTVRALMCSKSAIAWWVLPSATSWRISRSREVSRLSAGDCDSALSCVRGAPDVSRFARPRAMRPGARTRAVSVFWRRRLDPVPRVRSKTV